LSFAGGYFWRLKDDGRYASHLEITDEQRERFVALYLEALDAAGMPDDEAFRQAVTEHVEFGSHVAQQNSRAKTDDELHLIRQVPHWNWPA
jgi:hemoglobin